MEKRENLFERWNDPALEKKLVEMEARMPGIAGKLVRTNNIEEYEYWWTGEGTLHTQDGPLDLAYAETETYKFVVALYRQWQRFDQCKRETGETEIQIQVLENHLKVFYAEKADPEKIEMVQKEAKLMYTGRGVNTDLRLKKLPRTQEERDAVIAKNVPGHGPFDEYLDDEYDKLKLEVVDRCNLKIYLLDAEGRIGRVHKFNLKLVPALDGLTPWNIREALR